MKYTSFEPDATSAMSGTVDDATSGDVAATVVESVAGAYNTSRPPFAQKSLTAGLAAILSQFCAARSRSLVAPNFPCSHFNATKLLSVLLPVSLITLRSRHVVVIYFFLFLLLLLSAV
jgi:hypothetical protein